jgi:hypothetical protein
MSRFTGTRRQARDTKKRILKKREDENKESKEGNRTEVGGKGVGKE